VRVVLFAAAFALLAFAGAAQGRTSGGSVVLGGKTSFGPYGRGWGTAHPGSVDNGGDPSGKAWDLRWTHWGGGTASATGFTFLDPTRSRPWRKGRIEFRASRIGRCVSSGPRAYTRLQARVAELHGGGFGSWFLWNGRPNLCR